MRQTSKIGLVIMIVGLSILPYGADHDSIILPLIMFAIGGVIYLLFDSEDK